MAAGALNFDVKVTGVADVTRSLAILPARVREQVRKALLVESRLIVAAAKQLAPVDTGALRSSIKARWSKTNKLAREIVATGGARGRVYAAPVEYGRKKLLRQDAQPFLRPAMARYSLDMFQRTQDAVDQAVRSIQSTGLSLAGLLSKGGGSISNVASGIGRFGTLDTHGSISDAKGGGRGGGGGGKKRRKKPNAVMAVGIKKSKR